MGQFQEIVTHLRSDMKRCDVLQFICPSGLYGAEMWIMALAGNLDADVINCELAVTRESPSRRVELYDRYRQIGLPAHELKMNGRFDAAVIGRLCRLIRNRRFDIIHTHGYKSDLIGLAAARITGIKAISTPHGFEDVKDPKLKAYIRLGCLALRHFDLVLPLSDGLQGQLIEMGIDEGKIRLIPNGVDVAEIESEKVNPIEPLFENGLKIIGYIGRLSQTKNVPDLIRAYDLFYRDHPDSVLVIIGDGPLRRELEQLARGLPSASNVRFLGYRRDRLSLLRMMDVMSITSSLEGTPRCVMEAMVTGVPVAAFDVPGVDRLVIPGRTGASTAFGNIGELKNCWERVLYDENFRSKVIRNAKQHILDNFSATRMAQRYSELYREITFGSKSIPGHGSKCGPDLNDR